MRHRGVHVGTFFLGDKKGGQEFTSEDEEVLVLFASQAATAIANPPRTGRRCSRPPQPIEARRIPTKHPRLPARPGGVPRRPPPSRRNQPSDHSC